MQMKGRAPCAAGFLLCLTTALAVAQPTRNTGAIALPTDAGIRQVLAERAGALAGPDDGIGIVVGMIGPRGRRIVSYGHLSQGDPRSLDGDTVFEIGSVGKVFTALLLADMVRRGEVALTDPVAKYLHQGVRVPERHRSITLLDLATHTSGLPFMPDAYPVLNGPDAGYGAPELFRFLSSYRLTRDPGSDWDYSNIGYWLLGQALAARGGMDFERLLQTRILAPLKLKSTAATVSPTLKARLAVGHNAVLQPAPLFHAVSIYAAMGSAIGDLVSTTADLLALLSVAMGYEPSPLASSMAVMLSTRRPIGGEAEQALGWVVTGKGGDQLITHEGGTWGYTSYVAWDPASRVGVVVLSNQPSGVGDIARHLLRPAVPLERAAPMKHDEIILDSGVLDLYAGQYQAEDEGTVTIIRERDFLTLQLPVGWGLPRFRLRPESQRDFFVAELPVRVTIQTDSNGRVNGLLVYPPRGQRAVPAKRISRPD